MIRKCLIALILTAIVGGSMAQADPYWGVTTAMVYDWAEKTTTVDVYIKVVRWAQVYTRWAVVMTQRPTGEFCGCTWVQVCCNFPNLMIEATLDLEDTDSLSDLAEKWFLSLSDSGAIGPRDVDMDNAPALPTDCLGEPYVQVIGDGASTDKATLLLAGPHLTGELAYVLLCVKAEGVDPQAMMFLDNGIDKENIRKVGTVTLTYFPNDPPTASDWPESISTAPPASADLGAGPWNPDGPAPNGSGQSNEISTPDPI